MNRFLATLALLLLAAVPAAAQTNVVWGLATGANPRNLCVYDSTHACVTTGTLDSTLHVFTPSVPNGTITSGMLAAGVAAANLGFTPLSPANNLSDLTSATTARTNLGLGTAAVANTGTSGATLCLLNANCTFATMPTFTAGQLPPANGGTGLSTFTRSGNTTDFATATGTLTSGHCVSIDANGNFIDAGGTCTTGGGGGTVTAGTVGQLAYYSGTTNTGSFALAGDCTFTYPNITCLKVNGTAFSTLATLTPGTGVATALAASLNASTGLVGYSGALGTPTSGTLSNATGLPLATGVTGTLQAAQFPALTGDCVTTAGSLSVGCPFTQQGSGAVTTTLQKKVQQTVSVFDFMTAAQIADIESCGFALDEAPAIQAAINSMPAQGGDVAVPAGCYRLNSGLTIGNGTLTTASTVNGVRLVGQGSGWTRQIFSGGNRASVTFRAYGGNFAVVTMQGPSWGNSIQQINLEFDASVGANARGVVDVSNSAGVYRDLTFVTCGDYCVLETTATLNGSATAASNNEWHNIYVNLIGNTNTAAKAVFIGGSLAGGDRFYEHWTNLLIQLNINTQYGLYLQNQDTNFFDNFSVNFTAISGSPYAIVFDYAVANGGGDTFVQTDMTNNTTTYYGTPPLLSTGTALNHMYGFSRGNGAVIPVLPGLVVDYNMNDGRPISSGGGTTCAIKNIVGTRLHGQFQANASCSGGVVVLALPTAPTGWNCSLANLTNIINPISQSGASNVTTYSPFYIGTWAANDYIKYDCNPY